MVLPLAQAREKARWFHWTAVVAIAFPFIATTAGWVLTETGRQPWIVWGLQKTPTRTPRASATTARRLSSFVLLTSSWAIIDVVLMLRSRPASTRRHSRGHDRDREPRDSTY